MDKQQLLEYLKGEMIVSCQALPGEALYKEEGGIMCLMAQAVKKAGVKAIRAQGVLDIKQIKRDAFVDVKLVSYSRSYSCRLFIHML